MLDMNKSEVFFEKIKGKLIALGFQEKIAVTVAGLIRPEKLEGSILFADCKNGFYRDTIINAKLPEISSIAREVWGSEVELCLRSESDNSNVAPKKRVKAAPLQRDDASLFDFTPTVAPVLTEDEQKNTTFIQATKNINKISKPTNVTPNLTQSNESRNETTEDEVKLNPVVSGAAPAPCGKGLMPELTFSTFVRGSSNLMAHSACESVAQNPGQLTNPVFLYGATGLGKTHLLHAVGNEILKNHPDWQVTYVTSVDFMNELIASIRFNKQEIFRRKYRNCDVLLVDDIQFLENKESTQLEFFHTFNELYQNRKQIVITSDKYPKDIPNIEDRLKSRFLQGLIADVEPPSYEDRVAIIEAKRKLLGLKLSREVVLHIATHIKSNVREIQGVLNNLVMSQSMSGHAPTIESVNVLIKRMVRVQGSALDIHTVQKEVAKHFGIKFADLVSANRTQKLVWPRHIAMFLSKELMDSAVTEIAEAFGKKDHTTVMHAISKVKENLEKDTSTRAVINELKRRLDQNYSF